MQSQSGSHQAESAHYVPERKQAINGQQTRRTMMDPVKTPNCEALNGMAGRGCECGVVVGGWGGGGRGGKGVREEGG